jgi:hypothetical protein
MSLESTVGGEEFVSENTEETPLYDYPCLLVSDEDTPEMKVILFTENGVGTVIHSAENADAELGEYSDDWDMDEMSEYDSPVTIKND